MAFLLSLSKKQRALRLLACLAYFLQVPVSVQANFLVVTQPSIGLVSYAPLNQTGEQATGLRPLVTSLIAPAAVALQHTPSPSGGVIFLSDGVRIVRVHVARTAPGRLSVSDAPFLLVAVAAERVTGLAVASTGVLLASTSSGVWYLPPDKEGKNNVTPGRQPPALRQLADQSTHPGFLAAVTGVAVVGGSTVFASSAAATFSLTRLQWPSSRLVPATPEDMTYAGVDASAGASRGTCAASALVFYTTGAAGELLAAPLGDPSAAGLVASAADGPAVSGAAVSGARLGGKRRRPEASAETAADLRGCAWDDDGTLYIADAGVGRILQVPSSMLYPQERPLTEVVRAEGVTDVQVLRLPTLEN